MLRRSGGMDCTCATGTPRRLRREHTIGRSSLIARVWSSRVETVGVQRSLSARVKAARCVDREAIQLELIETYSFATARYQAQSIDLVMVTIT